MPVETMRDGDYYRINTRAYNLSGNVSQLTTAYFFWDVTPPTFALLKPATDYHSALPTISGTANDNRGGTNKAGIWKGAVGIQRSPYGLADWLTDNFTWGGETWKSQSAGGEVTWPDWVFLSTTNWSNNSPYMVRVRVLDNARNRTDEFTRTFTFDTASPEISIIK